VLLESEGIRTLLLEVSSETGAMLKLAAFFLTGTKGKIPFLGEFPPFV